MEVKPRLSTQAGWLATAPQGRALLSACRPRDVCLLFYCCALTVNCKEENRKMELGEKCRIDADLSPGTHAGCRVIAALGDILPVASPRQFPDFENIIQ